VCWRAGTGCPPALSRRAEHLFNGPPAGVLPATHFTKLSTFLEEAGKASHELRCYEDALGFIAQARDYEWQVQTDGKTKIPFYIHTNDQEIFAFAGLWDSSKTDAGACIESVTHITLPANNLIGEIHNTKHRMPAILEKADRDAWLSGTPGEAWEALVPYPDDLMVAWPVSTRVNTPRNNDATLVEPVLAQKND
jgi:hypothetical protein